METFLLIVGFLLRSYTEINVFSLGYEKCELMINVFSLWETTVRMFNQRECGNDAIKNSFHANLQNAGCEKLKRPGHSQEELFQIKRNSNPPRGMKLIPDFRHDVV